LMLCRHVYNAAVGERREAWRMRGITLTLHGGSSPMDAQANRLMPCCFQDCCFAPAGGVPADGTVTPAPGELGSSKHPDG
jgi:hypothetical protein